METKTGFESHPVSNLYFFESPIPPSELDGKGILLRFTHNGRSYEGVFEIDAWPHPTLAHFSAMSARAYTYSGLQVTYHAIKFDSSRASKIRRVKPDFVNNLSKKLVLAFIPEWNTILKPDFVRFALFVILVGFLAQIRAEIAKSIARSRTDSTKK